MSEDNKGIEKFNLFEAEREREIARAQQNERLLTNQQMMDFMKED